MSTLKQKAQDILDEKEEKIIPENIKKDIQIFDVTGTLEEGIDTSDATATENDLVENTTAYVNGIKISGNLVDQREQSSLRYDCEAVYGSDLGDNSSIYLQLPQDAPDMVIDSGNQFIGLINNEHLANQINLTADILKKDETVLGVVGTLESGTDTSDANATANDIVENTTAYVDGEKITGLITDRRDSQNIISLNVTGLQDNSGTEMWVDATPVLETLDTHAYAINENSTLEATVQYDDIVNELGITSDMIKSGEKILGIYGTYRGEATNDMITFVHPGDTINISTSIIHYSIDNLSSEDKEKIIRYEDNSSFFLYTIKLASVVDSQDRFDSNGIGIMIGPESSCVKGFVWDSNDDSVSSAFEIPIEAIETMMFPTEMTVRELGQDIEYLTNLSESGTIQFTYPNNAPVMPLLINNKFQIMVKKSSGGYEPFEIESSHGPIVEILSNN